MNGDDYTLAVAAGRLHGSVATMLTWLKTDLANRDIDLSDQTRIAIENVQRNHDIMSRHIFGTPDQGKAE